MNRNARFAKFALAAALLTIAVATQAAPIILTTTLNGANELPNPVPSPGTGVATVTLDPTAQTLQLAIAFSGLTSNVQAAHIHCCAAPGANAGVATTIPAFPGFPLGATSGVYSSQVFDLTQPLIYNPAFVTNNGGLAQAAAALIAGLLAGNTYLNIHTVNFPGGEIRGQLAVPEPATLALLGLAIAALGFARRNQ